MLVSWGNEFTPHRMCNCLDGGGVGAIRYDPWRSLEGLMTSQLIPPRSCNCRSEMTGIRWTRTQNHSDLPWSGHCYFLTPEIHFHDFFEWPPVAWPPGVYTHTRTHILQQSVEDSSAIELLQEVDTSSVQPFVRTHTHTHTVWHGGTGVVAVRAQMQPGWTAYGHTHSQQWSAVKQADIWTGDQENFNSRTIFSIQLMKEETSSVRGIGRSSARSGWTQRLDPGDQISIHVSKMIEKSTANQEQ